MAGTSFSNGSEDFDRDADYGNAGGETRRPGLGLVIVLSVTVATLTGVVAGSLAAWLILRDAQREPVPVNQAPVITYVQEAEARASAVYQAVAPSVVTVYVRDEDQPRRMGVGTGIIIDGDGHILTNNHVISEVERVRVELLDGSTLYAEVVGRDPSTDLAVIRANFPQGLVQIARFGDSGLVQPGDPVFAIGAPYMYGHSITAGIVSAVGRAYNSDDRRVSGLIQSDTEINPGNSGGPLLNDNGEVIGITTAILTTNRSFMGVGLSIPSNLVQQLLPQLIAGEGIRRAFLGIMMSTVTPKQALDDELGIGGGVSVDRVTPGSAASAAGMRRADIITAFDGEAVKNANDVIALIQSRGVGDTVTITVYRDGETLELTATLGERPAE